MSYQKLQNCYISIIGDCTITKKRKVTALIFLSFFSRVILELRLKKKKNHNFYFRLWLIVFYFYMDILFIVGRIYDKQKLSNFFFVVLGFVSF